MCNVNPNKTTGVRYVLAVILFLCLTPLTLLAQDATAFDPAFASAIGDPNVRYVPVHPDMPMVQLAYTQVAFDTTEGDMINLQPEGFSLTNSDTSSSDFPGTFKGYKIIEVSPKQNNLAKVMLAVGVGPNNEVSGDPNHFFPYARHQSPYNRKDNLVAEFQDLGYGGGNYRVIHHTSGASNESEFPSFYQAHYNVTDPMFVTSYAIPGRFDNEKNNMVSYVYIEASRRYLMPMINPEGIPEGAPGSSSLRFRFETRQMNRSPESAFKITTTDLDKLNGFIIGSNVYSDSGSSPPSHVLQAAEGTTVGNVIEKLYIGIKYPTWITYKGLAFLVGLNFAKAECPRQINIHLVGEYIDSNSVSTYVKGDNRLKVINEENLVAGDTRLTTYDDQTRLPDYGKSQTGWPEYDPRIVAQHGWRPLLGTVVQRYSNGYRDQLESNLSFLLVEWNKDAEITTYYALAEFVFGEGDEELKRYRVFSLGANQEVKLEFSKGSLLPSVLYSVFQGKDLSTDDETDEWDIVAGMWATITNVE